MGKQHLKGDFETSRSYGKAVVTEGGRTIYLAGVGAPVDAEGGSLAGNFAAQAHGCFAALQRNVEQAGGALSDLVTMTVFITDSRHGTEFVDIRRGYFPDGNFPASALIGVASLAKPEMLVEIQAVAVVGG